MTALPPYARLVTRKLSLRHASAGRLTEGTFDRRSRAAVFKMLHEPPAEHGINRTSWTLALLCKTLKENGTPVGISVVAKMIKGAGYKWRKAKVVLTSNDPTYMEKLASIRFILS